MKPAKSKKVTAAELSRVSGYSPPSITAWTKHGILQRDRGRYDLAEALEAIKAHETKRASDGGHHDTGEIGKLKADLLRKRIEKLDAELAILRGKMHDTMECVASLGSVLSVVWTEITALPGRAQAAFPEIPGLESVLVSMIKETAASIRTFAEQTGADIKQNKANPGSNAGNTRET